MYDREYGRGQKRRPREPQELPSDTSGVMMEVDDESIDAEVVEPTGGDLTAVRPLDLPDDVSSIERDLEQDLRRQLKVMDSGTGGMDLTEVEYDKLHEADHTRLARLTYGMGYLRLLAFLSRKPPNMSVEAQQAKLSLAYIQHVETNDRATMRLAARSSGEAQLDKDLIVLREDITRIAMLKHRRTEKISGPTSEE
jgi:hypothetical protein